MEDNKVDIVYFPIYERLIHILFQNSRIINIEDEQNEISLVSTMMTHRMKPDNIFHLRKKFATVPPGNKVGKIGDIFTKVEYDFPVNHIQIKVGEATYEKYFATPQKTIKIGDYGISPFLGYFININIYPFPNYIHFIYLSSKWTNCLRNMKTRGMDGGNYIDNKYSKKNNCKCDPYKSKELCFVCSLDFSNLEACL